LIFCILNLIKIKLLADDYKEWVSEEEASCFEEALQQGHFGVENFDVLYANFPFEMQFFFIVISSNEQVVKLKLGLSDARLNTEALNSRILQIVVYKLLLFLLFFIGLLSNDIIYLNR
jgi:hypothetical protein